MQRHRIDIGPALITLLATTGVWCILMPFVWARSLDQFVDISYLDRLRLYLPELVVATAVAFSLILIFVSYRVAIFGFAVASIMTPVATLTIGSPTSGVWPITFGLLIFAAWRLHVNFKKNT